MNKKTILTIVIIVILVVVGIILVKNMPAQKTIKTTVPKETVTPGTTPNVETPIAPVEGAKQAAPGTSFVTKEGEVVTPEGTPVKQDALPGAPEAPKQSKSLTETEIPAGSVQLNVTASGFTPNEFSVKAGQVVTLTVTAGDEKTHVFKFDDASLSAVAIGIAGHETRAITFKAPAKGDYSFFCDVPGHSQRGEKGVMHVK
ncbi:MAG: cupredoxin domain-containing protein [Patescibacteria group bacterium]|nr:cupredoxin domain-containing protein [Patescibacteria group bacterium]MDD5534449.1 cupredoxin domain-containing protein [Patescibacteria group bacterium]